MTQQQDEYSITPIQRNSGIHYEHLGISQLYNDLYEIISYIDLREHNLKLKYLQYYYSKAETYCQTKVFKNKQVNTTNKAIDLCSNFAKLARPIINQVEKEKDILNQLVGHKVVQNRRKRSLFNFVGKATKFLFGTLDEDDAEYYNERITQFTENEQHLVQILKDQSHVIQTTITNFNDTIRNLNINEKILKENMDKLEILSNQELNDIKLLGIKININEQLSNFIMLYVQFQLETQTIVNAILAARNGQLHPVILTPEKLMLELQNVSTHHYLNFPVMPTIENAHLFLNFLTLNVFYRNERLIYVLSIPMTDSQEYDMYKLTPLPVHVADDKYIFIQPTKQYLAISSVKQKYVLFTSDQFSKCTEFTKSQYICQQQTPIFLTHQHECCEVKLLHATTTIPENCDKRLVHLDKNIWYQLITSNSWIFVLNTPERITINCQSKLYDEIVKDIGILKLDEKCKAFTHSALLIPHKITSSKIENRNFIPHVELTIDCCESETDHNKVNESKIHFNPNFNTVSLHLDDLGVASKKLEELDDSLDSFKWLPSSWHTNISVLSIIFMIILIITLLYCCCCKRRFCRRCCGAIPGICIRITNSSHTQNREETSVAYQSNTELASVQLPQASSCTSIAHRPIIGRRSTKDCP